MKLPDVGQRMFFAGLAYALVGALLVAIAIGSQTASKPSAAPPTVVYIPTSLPAAPSETAVATAPASPSPLPSPAAVVSPPATQPSLSVAGEPAPLIAIPAPPRPSPSPQASPASAPPPLPSSVVVYITDDGFVGPHVSIPRDGQVTWVNVGQSVHSATAVGPVRPFDTGGLARGQSATQTLSVPGRYAYTSAPDCIGNRSTFNCSDSFTVTVG